MLTKEALDYYENKVSNYKVIVQPITGTPMDDIVYPNITTGVNDKDTFLELISKLTEPMTAENGEVMTSSFDQDVEALSDFLAKHIGQHINFIANEISPLAKWFYDSIVNFEKELEISNQTKDVILTMPFYYPLWLDEKWGDDFKKVKSMNLDKTPSLVNLAHSPNMDKIIEEIIDEHGSDCLAWLQSHLKTLVHYETYETRIKLTTKDYLNFVFNEYFTSKNKSPEVYTRYLTLTNHERFIEALAVLYLSNTIYDEPDLVDDASGGSLSDFNRAIEATEQWALNEVSNLSIQLKQATDRQVLILQRVKNLKANSTVKYVYGLILNGHIYDYWKQNKYNDDIFIGHVLANRTQSDIETLLANKEANIRDANYYYEMFYNSLAENKLTDVTNFIKSIFHSSLENLTEVEKEYKANHTGNYEDTAIDLLYNYLADLTTTDLDSIDEVSLVLASRCRNFFTDGYKLLKNADTIHETMLNKGHDLDGHSVLSIATPSYIVEHLMSQLNITNLN